MLAEVADRPQSSSTKRKKLSEKSSLNNFPRAGTGNRYGTFLIPVNFSDLLTGAMSLIIVKAFANSNYLGDLCTHGDATQLSN